MIRDLRGAQAFEFANIYSIEDVQRGYGGGWRSNQHHPFRRIRRYRGKAGRAGTHVSEISHTYIMDPNEALKLNQHVQVKVLEVDVARKRIALSIKQTQEAPARKQQKATGIKMQESAPKKPASLPAKKEETPLNMNDALSALKKKFGK